MYTEDYGQWILWANQSHAGIESWVYVKDEASRLLVYFFSKKGERVVRLTFGATEACFEAVLRGPVVFDGREVYRLEGWREVRLYKVEVGG